VPFSLLSSRQKKLIDVRFFVRFFALFCGLFSRSKMFLFRPPLVITSFLTSLGLWRMNVAVADFYCVRSCVLLTLDMNFRGKLSQRAFGLRGFFRRLLGPLLFILIPFFSLGIDGLSTGGGMWCLFLCIFSFLCPLGLLLLSDPGHGAFLRNIGLFASLHF